MASLTHGSSIFRRATTRPESLIPYLESRRSGYLFGEVTERTQTFVYVLSEAVTSGQLPPVIFRLLAIERKITLKHY
jgi:hypothetical protein